MSQHLQNALEALKRRVLSLGAIVENNLRFAVESVETRDTGLAERVMSGDAFVDRMEVDIEEECLKVLALHQPVAADLRLIITVLRINNDIERVADLAVNIAERALFLCTQPPIEAPYDFDEMCRRSLAMLGESLDALVRQDTKLARRVRASDARVNAINREMYAKTSAAVRKNPDHVEPLLSYLSVSRHLERIADYATNIAEDVIYLVEGAIVRHRPAAVRGDD